MRFVTFCRKCREPSIFDGLPPGAGLRAPVTFWLAQGRARKDPVPGGGEEAGRVALAEAIGALAAHPRGCGGAGDGAGAREGVEEAELAGRSPAVPAEALGRALLVHRPA